MTTAFAHFDEPLAWLVRGLIEYGLTDVTTNAPIPPGSLGGFDLSFIPASQGQSGLVLRLPAAAGGQVCSEDDYYSFDIKLIHIDDAQGFAVRCADCNYLQEFTFDPSNPLWAAGYIHQSLSEYVPEFVRWRLGGGELTWAQRQGVPEVTGEPCSASLATWLNQQLTLHRAFHARLWGQVTADQASAQRATATPMVTVGNFGVQNGAGGTTPRSLLQGPAGALSVMIYLGGVAAVMALVNVLLTVALFGVDRMFAVTTSILLLLFAGGGGVAAWFGLREYRQMKGTILPWVAIVYPALIPICCLGGLPISIWAGMRWSDPAVVARRNANLASR